MASQKGERKKKEQDVVPSLRTSFRKKEIPRRLCLFSYTSSLRTETASLDFITLVFIIIIIMPAIPYSFHFSFSGG